MVPGQGAPAGLGRGDRDACRLGKGSQTVFRPRVEDAATRDDERPVGAADRVHGGPQRVGVRPGAPDAPLAVLQELDRDVERFGLYVLGQSDRDGSRLDRVGEDAHRGERDREELLGPLYAVEEPGQRAERVVDAQPRVVRHLDLLEHRVGDTRRERVARQEERGQPVRRRERGARQHVGGPRADGRGARQCRAAAMHARIPDGLMDHGLLVARLVVRQELGVGPVHLLQGLAHTGHVAVPEDAHDRGHGALADRAVDRPLTREELGQRLGDGHASRRGHGAHDCASTGPVPGVNGSRGSTC
ncbi:hypothetical protein GCM10025865_14030 [Paraoerskovia sediminicola]|uniref:Uncharacterized protein n=1 Tax=Paraoerskovia sediminicola TaxID=1138587 RepID=A0ABN6XB87_9CELL|nr:hypothetical protein GCM10025865_14030 [Paraoerskovia sediminicola]